MLMTAILIAHPWEEAKAQDDSGFIYGTVTTHSGRRYIGQIRWGKEEAFWNDLLNSNKIANRYTKFLPKDKKDKDDDGSWLNIDWQFLSIWDDKNSGSGHLFAMRFGDISSLEIKSGSTLLVGMKNGAKLKVQGGSNDIGTTLLVYDQEIGKLRIKWSQIERVDFSPSPKRLRNKLGEPLFGVVETLRNGKFEGYIQWDHDERISTDILDCDSKEGDLEIPFGNIKGIESRSNGCILTLKSNREMYVDGSNDVDRGNRGIIVTTVGVGKIDIPWKEFKKVTFKPTNSSGPDYESYPRPKALRGKVKVIDGNTVSGLIVFDLDEAWDAELLDGKIDNISYRVPFRNIKTIIPRNYNYSNVLLKNGEDLLLGDAQDVSENNGGLLVYSSRDEKPTYVRWKKIDEITFE